METWGTVLVAFIVAVSTIGATCIQNRYSNRQFKQQRRQEVRSEPLLKLRSELARMASKLDKLTKSAHIPTVMSNKTDEQIKEALEKAINDWNNYISGDDLEQILFIQADAEIINLVKEIRNEYLESYDKGVTYRKELTAKELGEAARAPEEKIAPKIIKAQSLINQRLEEL
jgi:ligand-binding sensor domain-containing protein